MRKSVFFILPSLRIGGAEKFIIKFANYLVKNPNFSVSLILLTNGIKEKDYNLDKKIRLILLNYKSSILALPKLLVYIWKNKPDIVFSTLVHLNFLISLLCIFFPRNTKTIIREAAIISLYLEEKNSFLLKLMYKFIYVLPDFVISQSKDMETDLLSNFNLSKEKSFVINNFADHDIKSDFLNKDIFLSKGKTSNDKSINLLSIGRLTEQKNFSFLISVMHNLPDHYFLKIVGDGILMEPLKNQVKALNLESKVHFTGFKENVDIFYQNADIFILASKYEGFPNVLLEALSFKLPIVCSNFPGGANEIIEKTQGGIIVESNSPKDFAKLLIDFNYKHFKNNINLEYFSKEFIFSKYVKLLNDYEEL